MWTVVYLTRNKDVAQKLKTLLTDEGILVKLNDNVEKGVDVKKKLIEVLVPETEAEEAQSIILKCL